MPAHMFTFFSHGKHSAAKIAVVPPIFPRHNVFLNSHASSSVLPTLSVPAVTTLACYREPDHSKHSLVGGYQGHQVQRSSNFRGYCSNTCMFTFQLSYSYKYLPPCTSPQTIIHSSRFHSAPQCHPLASSPLLPSPCPRTLSLCPPDSPLCPRRLIVLVQMYLVASHPASPVVHHPSSARLSRSPMRRTLHLVRTMRSEECQQIEYDSIAIQSGNKRQESIVP